MGGGEDSLSDAELARMIYELERSSLSEQDFNRRLSMLVNPSQPAPEPVVNLSPISVSNLNFSQILVQPKICLICQASVDDKWVQLPRCHGEHIYCMTCAPRLVTQSGFDWNSNQYQDKITCTSCRVSEVFARTDGLKDFIRQKQEERGRVSYEDGTCPFHKTLLVYFCLQCSEPICVACSTGYHSGHKIETLDTAFVTKTKHLEDTRKTISSKRVRAVNAIERLVNARNQITDAASQRQLQLTRDIDEMQQELERKRLQLSNDIRAMERQKLENVERLLDENSRILDTYDNALHLLSQGTDKSRNSGKPMQFMIDKKEQLNPAITAAEPLAYHNYNTTLPALPTKDVKNKISSLAYI